MGLVWLVATAFWVAYTISYAGQIMDQLTPNDVDVPWLVSLAMSAIAIVPFWTVATVALLALVRRTPIARGTWLRGLVTMAVAIAGVLVARGLYLWAVVNPSNLVVFPPWYEPDMMLPDFLARSFLHNHMTVIAIVCACYGWVHLLKAHENRVQIAELETRLTRARLDALSAQLNPHFLFNALNSIAELIHLDPDAADRMLTSLSALLRFSLSSVEHEVKVEDETALVAQYLSIEKIRYGDRLDVRWSVDADCAHALVPALILQPLAENAIVHGIARRRAPGMVQIAIRRVGDMLVMEVSNDGRSPDAPPRDGGTGIGLANTQARLRCLYGDRWTLQLHTGDDARATVRVELPLRIDDTLRRPPINDPDHGSAPAAATIGQRAS